MNEALTVKGPGGSWRLSARNVVVKGGVVDAELQNSRGEWIQNREYYGPGTKFANIDGKFQREA